MTYDPTTGESDAAARPMPSPPPSPARSSDTGAAGLLSLRRHITCQHAVGAHCWRASVRLPCQLHMAAVHASGRCAHDLACAAVPGASPVCPPQLSCRRGRMTLPAGEAAQRELGAADPKASQQDAEASVQIHPMPQHPHQILQQLTEHIKARSAQSSTCECVQRVAAAAVAHVNVGAHRLQPALAWASGPGILSLQVPTMAVA